MEVHAAPPAVGKRLWSYVRAAIFMARNGKRKLLLSMHLLGAKKRKAVARTVANLLTHHHHANNAYALRRRDYEFSCTNSPAAASSSSSRRRLAHFPCLGAVAEDDDYEYRYHQQQYDGYGGSLALPDASPSPARIQYYASASASAAGDLDLAPGEEEEDEEYACTPSASASPGLLLPGAASGEFSVRVSNYSSEDEAAAAGAAGSHAVDADAEDFIRRFYDQLRRQNTIAMLPYYMQQEPLAAA